MHRITRKREDGIHEMDFVMESISERDEWLKYFPWPIPPGYVGTYRWLEDQMTLRTAIEPQAGPAAKALRESTADLSGHSEADIETRAAEKGIDVRGKKKRQLVEELQK